MSSRTGFPSCWTSLSCATSFSANQYYFVLEQSDIVYDHNTPDKHSDKVPRYTVDQCPTTNSYPTTLWTRCHGTSLIGVQQPTVLPQHPDKVSQYIVDQCPTTNTLDKVPRYMVDRYLTTNISHTTLRTRCHSTSLIGVQQSTVLTKLSGQGDTVYS